MTSRLSSRIGMAVAIAIKLFVVASAVLVDPLSSRWAPKCFLFQKTGIKCPACGTQQAVHHLSNANFAEAMEANALFVGGLVIICLYLIVMVWRMLISKSIAGPLVMLEKWIWHLLFVIVLFTIFRNIISFL